MIERPTIVDNEHLLYLDAIRDSGTTNMFGAASYLVGRFGINDNDARKILSYWMKSFGERHSGE